MRQGGVVLRCTARPPEPPKRFAARRGREARRVPSYGTKGASIWTSFTIPCSKSAIDEIISIGSMVKRAQWCNVPYRE
jgi:hypothetical protein